MDAVVDFLEGIGDGFVAVIDFLVSFFGDLVYMIELTGKFLTQIPDYFSWLPDTILVMLVTLFTIVVLYKLLGREG